MPRPYLRDDQWEKIAPLLPGKKTDCGVTAKDNRLFLEAILWIVRTGAPWRDLPIVPPSTNSFTKATHAPATGLDANQRRTSWKWPRAGDNFMSMRCLQRAANEDGETFMRRHICEVDQHAAVT